MIASLDNWIAVIPVRNEALTIGAIVAEACAYLPVIVVDDASDDGSGQLAVAAGATVVTLPRQQGKGTALRCGFVEALKRGVATVVTLDGDGQHDPQDIPRFVAASQHWPGCIIIGDRLETEAQIPRHRLHAIRVGSFGINWMGGCNIRDTQSGFRVYPTYILKTLLLKHGGFLLESEILIKAGQAGCTLREIPIRAVYHPGQTSHYRPFRDGAIAAIYLFYCGMRFWPTQIRRLVLAARTDHDSPPRHAWHQTRVAALATGLLPVLFLLMLAQLLLGRVGLDMLAPFIRRFYDQRLLHSLIPVRKTLYDRQRHNKWEHI
jgi:glycosyltransferase involved in cell wall biosynthesis